MIVSCEKCNSKFNLNDKLLKVGGSKVRCSKCRHVFVVKPPEPEKKEDFELDESFEETAALDTPPDFGDIGAEAPEEEPTEDFFDKTFEDTLEDEVIEEISAQGLYEEKKIIKTQTEKPKEEPKKDVPKRPPIKSLREKRHGSSKLLIILVVVLVLIIAAVGIYFFIPDVIPDSLSFLKPVQKEMASDQGVNRLDFKNVKGSFMQTNKSGQVFIIRGMVVNNGVKTRSFILIKGSILDDTEKMIRQMLVYAGNTYTDSELKSKALSEIKDGLKVRTGKGNSNVDVSPGESVPFLIVFENLPDNLGEFVVEAVSASPGK